MEIIFSWVMFLIIAGFLLILLDLFVFPGTSVLGISGIGALVWGVVRMFLDFGNLAGWIALLSILLVCASIVLMFVRKKSWKKMILNDNLEGRVNEVNEQKVKVGDEGKAISRLVPVGQATFEGEIVEVHSLDGFTDQKTQVKVVKIEKNKIFVTAVY
jgi:membrane-bound ClpP family serine protease